MGEDEMRPKDYQYFISKFVEEAFNHLELLREVEVANLKPHELRAIVETLTFRINLK